MDDYKTKTTIMVVDDQPANLKLLEVMLRGQGYDVRSFPRGRLALAAAVEHDSEHTIAQGIVKSAEERGLSVPSANAFQAVPGRGVQAVVNGRQLLLGGPALLRQVNAQIAPMLQAAIDRAAARGQSAITMVDGTMPVAVFAVADAVRDESREAVQRLHEEHVEVIMMTGDAQAVANAVATDLGIDTVFAVVPSRFAISDSEYPAILQPQIRRVSRSINFISFSRMRRLCIHSSNDSLLRPETCHRHVKPGFTLKRLFCHASSIRNASRTDKGRGPTRLMSPSSTFQSCGSSSRLHRLNRRPTRVTRGSSGNLKRRGS